MSNNHVQAMPAMLQSFGIGPEQSILVVQTDDASETRQFAKNPRVHLGLSL
jgi:hypothetical protein